MKYLITLLFIFCSGQAYATNYCSGNAQACYLFTEGSGTSVADSTGNGNTGTFNSSGHPAWSGSVPSYGVFGSAAGSVNYSTAGSSEIISTGTANTLAPYNGAWTFCSWIYPTVDVVGGGDPRIFARGSVYFALAATKLLYISIAGAVEGDFFTANNAVTYNTWQHVCASVDGGTTSTNWKVYVNGVSQSKNAGGNVTTPTSNSGATTYIGNVSSGLRSSGSNMTDVMFFNTQVSDATVLDIYNYGPLGSQQRTATFNKATLNKVNLN